MGRSAEPTSRPAVAGDDAGNARLATERLPDSRAWPECDRPSRPACDRPKPLQPAGEFPPGFVRRHRAAANPLAERHGARPRLPGRAVHGVNQTAAREGQPVRVDT